MADELAYLLQRSEAEAIRSIQSPHPVAAAVHGELCLLYTSRALATLLTRREGAV